VRGRPRAPLVAYACLALSMALVGSYVGLSRLLVAVFPVFLLAWLRFAIAAVAMIHWVRPTADEPPLSRAQRQLLFWESFLGNFLFSVFMLFGVALSSAVSAGVVMAAMPAVVALLSRVFLGESISRRMLAAIGCAAVGIALLAMARDAGTPSTTAEATTTGQWLGHLLLLGAVFCEASYVVIGKRLATHVSPRRISALINLWGLALVTPLGLWQANRFDFAGVPAATWALLVFYSLAASMATVWLWMRGQRDVPAAQAGIFTVMLPIAAACIGIGVLGEPFGRGHAVALALAVAGLLLATWPARPQTAEMT